jgi:hypothetical protein
MYSGFWEKKLLYFSLWRSGEGRSRFELHMYLDFGKKFNNNIMIIIL